MRNIFPIICGILLFTIIAISGCNENNQNLDLGMGRALYNGTCQPCHNYLPQSNYYYPSLLEMTDMDSITFEKKLKSGFADSLHNSIIKKMDMDDIENIKYFLRNYDWIEY